MGSSAPPVSSSNVRAALNGTMQPANRRVAFLGDSRTFVGRLLDAGNAAWSCDGFIFWTRFLSKQRFDVLFSDNYGVNGEDSQDILARTDAMLAATDAGTIVILASTNDRSGVTANYPDVLSFTQTMNNLAGMRDKCLAAGRIVVFIAETPRGNANFTSNRPGGVQLTWHIRTHRWLIDQARIQNVYVVDPWPLLADPATVLCDGLIPMTKDGTHLTKLANYLLATLLSEQLNFLFPPLSILNSTNGDNYAAENPRGDANPNFNQMLGTTGTLVGGSGNMPTGWTNEAIPAGVTAVYAKVVDAAGVEWAQVTLSGTPTAASPVVNAFKATPGPSYLAIGDVLEAVCAMRTDAGCTGVHAIKLNITDAVSGFRIGDGTEVGVWPGWEWPNAALDGIMRTPAYPITGTNLRLYVTITLQQNVACNLTLRVRACSVRKAQSASVF